MRVLLNLRDLLAVGVSGATSLLYVSQGMATPVSLASHEGGLQENIFNSTRLQQKTFQAKTFEPQTPGLQFHPPVESLTSTETPSAIYLFKPLKQSAIEPFSQDLSRVQFHPQLASSGTTKISTATVQLSKPLEKPTETVNLALYQTNPIKLNPIAKQWNITPQILPTPVATHPRDQVVLMAKPLSSKGLRKFSLFEREDETNLEAQQWNLPFLSTSVSELENIPVVTNAAALETETFAMGWEYTEALPSIVPASTVTTSMYVSTPTQLAQVTVDEVEEVDLPDLNPPTEPYPQPAPDGTLQTNPPPITLPSANPLYRPNAPEQVEIQETVPITLEQAIDLARRNNPSVRQFALQVEQQLAALRVAQAALYPTLSFTSTLARTENAQTTLSSRAQNRSLRNARRIERSRRQDIIDTEAQEILSGDRDPENVTQFAPFPAFSVPFGSTTFNNTLQLVYDFGIDGQRDANIRANEEQLENTQLDLERVVEDLRSNVTESYYDLQQADANVEIQRSAVRNAQKSLEDAEALERAGVGTRFEVLQARVTLSRNQQNLTNAISQQRASRRVLATLVNVSQNANLVTADPIELAGAWDYTLDETIVLAYQYRAELEEELNNREIAEQQRKAALAATRPQLSAAASYNVLGQITDDPDPFATRGWADGYSLQLQLQWNFFDGGATKARARQQEINIALSEERFSQLRNDIRQQVEVAFYDLQANFENIGVANLGVEEATEALRLARLRFQAGVGTQTDVINQETALTTARNQLLQAIIGYNRSLSQLWRAVSNLPGGNLQNQP
ncbi:MAG: TolC family protein [Microcoleaceae cyanobacterium]